MQFLRQWYCAVAIVSPSFISLSGVQGFHSRDIILDHTDTCCVRLGILVLTCQVVIFPVETSRRLCNNGYQNLSVWGKCGGLDLSRTERNLGSIPQAGNQECGRLPFIRHEQRGGTSFDGARSTNRALNIWDFELPSFCSIITPPHQTSDGAFAPNNNNVN